MALPASSLIFYHKASIDSAIACTRPLFGRGWLLVHKANEPHWLCRIHARKGRNRLVLLFDISHCCFSLPAERESLVDAELLLLEGALKQKWISSSLCQLVSMQGAPHRSFKRIAKHVEVAGVELVPLSAQCLQLTCTSPAAVLGYRNTFDLRVGSNAEDLITVCCKVMQQQAPGNCRRFLVAYMYSLIVEATMARALTLVFIALTKNNPAWLGDHPGAVVQPLLIYTGIAYAYEKIPHLFLSSFLKLREGEGK